MCGIVGLFLKDKTLEPQLGSLVAGMLATMCDRGPDSAGFAVYGSGNPGSVKLTLRATSSAALEALLPRLAEAAGGGDLAPVLRDTHMTITVPAQNEAAVRTKLAALAP